MQMDILEESPREDEPLMQEMEEEMEVDPPPSPAEIPEPVDENKNTDKLHEPTSNIRSCTSQTHLLRHARFSNRLIDSPYGHCPFAMSRTHMIDTFITYLPSLDGIGDKMFEDETERRFACYANESPKTYKREQMIMKSNMRMLGDSLDIDTETPEGIILPYQFLWNDGSGDQQTDDDDANITENIKILHQSCSMTKFRTVCPPDSPEITDEMDKRITTELENNDDEDVIAHTPITNSAVTRKDLKEFAPGKWLSDSIVNFYLELIQKRSQGGESTLKIYCFEAIFNYNLRTSDIKDSDMEKLVETTGNENIFLYDLAFVPICKSHHWRLVVANMRTGILQMYNSMDTQEADEEITKLIKAFLQDEYRRKHDNEESPFAWDTEPAHIVPQQKNKDDCGVFMLQFADYLSRRKEFTFDQKHIPYFRRRMVFEVVTGQLLSLTQVNSMDEQ